MHAVQNSKTVDGKSCDKCDATPIWLETWQKVTYKESIVTQLNNKSNRFLKEVPWKKVVRSTTDST